MRRAALLYNPLSGGRQERRLADVEAVLKVLREAGVEVSANITGGAVRAAEQARQAVVSGCDVVFACGGDGTVHDVLQGLVGSQTALGVIPLGTANALAHDLGLPLEPVQAARALLTAEPRRFAAGRVDYRDLAGQRSSRYFTVAAGVGVDAHLFYELSATVKSRLGMSAYYAHSTYLWLTHPMDWFEVEFPEPGGGPRREAVSELLAVRIAQFGGVLRELAPGASLDTDQLRLVLFKTRSRFRYLRYIACKLLGLKGSVPGIELISVERVACRQAAQEDKAAQPTRIFVEADGEPIGILPAEISIVPDALTLLMPRR